MGRPRHSLTRNRGPWPLPATPAQTETQDPPPWRIPPGEQPQDPWPHPDAPTRPPTWTSTRPRLPHRPAYPRLGTCGPSPRTRGPPHGSAGHATLTWSPSACTDTPVQADTQTQTHPCSLADNGPRQPALATVPAQPTGPHPPTPTPQIGRLCPLFTDASQGPQERPVPRKDPAQAGSWVHSPAFLP